MANRVVIKPGPDIVAPSVSIAPARAKPSFLKSLIEGGGAAAIESARKVQEKKLALVQEEDQNTRMLEFVDNMTSFAEEQADLVGEDYTAGQAKIATSIELNRRLKDSGINSKLWSNINTQVNNITSEIGKGHYFTADGLTFIRQWDGEVVQILPPGVTEEDASVEALVAALPAKIAAHLTTVAETNPEEAARMRESYLSLNYKAEMFAMRNKGATFHANNLKLSEAKRKALYPENKAELLAEFNSLSQPLLRTSLKLLQNTEVDPNVTYESYETQLRDWIFNSDNLPALQSAGFSSANELWKEQAGYLESVKSQMEINSLIGRKKLQTRQDREALERAKIRTELRLAALAGEMTDAELLAAEKPGLMSNLIGTSLFLEAAAKNPQVRAVFPAISNRISNINMGGKQIKLATRELAEDDLEVYINLINELTDMTSVLSSPESSRGSLRNISGDYYLFLGNSLFKDPKWDSLKENRPEDAERIKEAFEKIKSQVEKGEG
jgi:hypothetical protein